MLWADYKRQPMDALRNDLVERHMHLVRYAAERIHARTPECVELDDLISAGVFGLISAIERFDPGCGVQFHTYAPRRIRGHILDSLRAGDWAPRNVRHCSSVLYKARSTLRNQLGRPADNDELMAELKVSPVEFRRMLKHDSHVATTSLSRKVFETDAGHQIDDAKTISDLRVPDPSTRSINRELRDHALAGLNRAETLMIRLLYEADLTMKEVGRAVGLSESRISQMHTNVIARIRARFSVAPPPRHRRRLHSNTRQAPVLAA
ncbi:FliA/WhiG family RNA polymerase sigma factor [soil metagenome]